MATIAHTISQARREGSEGHRMLTSPPQVQGRAFDLRSARPTFTHKVRGGGATIKITPSSAFTFLFSFSRPDVSAAQCWDVSGAHPLQQAPPTRKEISARSLAPGLPGPPRPGACKVEGGGPVGGFGLEAK